VSSAGHPPFCLSLLGDRGTDLKRVAEDRASSLNSKDFVPAPQQFSPGEGVQKGLVLQRFQRGHQLVGSRLEIFSKTNQLVRRLY
jgi:hypothetical protein